MSATAITLKKCTLLRYHKSKHYVNLFSTIKLHVTNKKMDEDSVLAKCKKLAPPLSEGKHKGQAGRIGVFGGSRDYTGAPYFSAISSLKAGADLVYVFTIKEAAPIIKSYSPELIVHPYLDDGGVEKIEPWLDRLNTAVIGPGLGRDDSTFQVMEKIIERCKTRKTPLVIDADGLVMVSQKPEIIKDYPAPVILTPNVKEFQRLVGNNGDGNKPELTKHLFELCKNLTIVCKGRQDEIFDQTRSVKVSKGGSGRRCGGQGDLLSGSLGTFLSWALNHPEFAEDERTIIAGYAACKLTRDCNAKAFKNMGRAMLTTDMIAVLHEVFAKQFEL